VLGSGCPEEWGLEMDFVQEQIDDLQKQILELRSMVEQLIEVIQAEEDKSKLHLVSRRLDSIEAKVKEEKQQIESVAVASLFR
jgi:hypothetical protein